MSGGGFVLPAAAVGLGPLLLRPKYRAFLPRPAAGPAQPIIAQAVLEEQHSDEMRITEHPVEQGAAIADHAYKMPATVVIRGLWSNSPSGPSGPVSQAVATGAALSKSAVVGVAASLPQTIQAVQSILNSTASSGLGSDAVSSIYATLLDLQISRTLFDVFTGKRVYRDMLMISIAVETNTKLENALLATIRCQQVLLARTQLVTLQADVQADPAATAAVVNRGAQSMFQSAVQNGALL